MKAPFHGPLLALACLPLLTMAADDPDPMAALRALEAPENRPVPFMEDSLALSEGSTVALLGGTDMLNEQRYGFLEASLRQAFPGRSLHFRNLAWSADTVSRQQRPLHFYDKTNFDKQPGSSQDLRKRIRPDAIILWFGKMESLQGAEALDQFSEDYAVLLDRLLKLTPRIALLGPTPFQESGPASQLAEERNAVLTLYAESIQDLASNREVIYVDLLDQTVPDLSWNGVHLNESGHRNVAAVITERLTGVTPGPPKAKIFTLIKQKNQIWDQYYRPTNWAFLYGDRQHVPSSRDHEDSEKRWFPTEIERAIPLIDELETRLHEVAR